MQIDEPCNERVATSFFMLCQYHRLVCDFEIYTQDVVEKCVRVVKWELILRSLGGCLTGYFSLRIMERPPSKF